MKKWFLMALLSFSFTASAWAVPAKSGQWRILTLSDGRQVRAELVGDEFMHFWQSESGDCYIHGANGFRMASKGVLLQEAQAARAQRNQQRWQRLARTRGLDAPHTSYVGKKKGLIILVQFNDLSFSVADPLATFNKVINGENYTEGDFIGSVHDYFKNQSRGVFELDFDVLGPVTMKNGYAYYGQDGEKRGSDKHPGEMVADALKAVSDKVNFADYDWDGDYIVDQVFVVFAGKGQADGGADDTIWPHEWSLEYAYGSKPVFGNYIVNTYACGPELNGSGKLNGIGTICHEFSHCLGLPDTYDTAYNGNYGMGTWDLMCSGSHSGNGFLPPNYTAFEQAYIGWRTPIELTSDTEVTGMKPVIDGGEIYQLTNPDYPDEFFMLENRQKTGWDGAVGSSGILVTHIDFNPDVWRYNVVNTVGGGYASGRFTYVTDHQHLTIVPADGSAGDNLADTYPYNLKDSITNTSSPAFSLYHAKADGSTLLGRAITNIRQDSDGTISFKFRAVDTNTKPSLSGVVFKETFNQCDGQGGNDGLWGSGAGSGKFVSDNVGWTVTADGGANQCAKFGTFTKKGIVTTPKFGVSGTTKLTFRAAPWGDETCKVGITVFSGSNVSVSPSTFELTPGQWTDCEALISGTGEVSVRFTPSQNRFFLDDIIAQIEGSAAPTAIQRVTLSETDPRIFDLQGRMVGTDLNALPRGLYIIGGKKVVK